MRIGVILTPDNAIDPELTRWCPGESSVHVTRIQVDGWQGLDDVDQSLAFARPDAVAAATRSLTPIGPDVIAYACTSGSFASGLKGERAIRQTILDAGAREAVTTSGALLDALRALRAGRVAVATPYDDRCGGLLADCIAEAGFRVVSQVNEPPPGGLGLDDVPRDHILSLARRAADPRAEVLFVSCTALETVNVVPTLVGQLGIPVLSAVQVTMWGAWNRVRRGEPGEEAFEQLTAGCSGR